MNIYFGENLKKLRKERELTQETLADFLGVSFQAVSKWERSESYPDITMLPVISDFFNVSTDRLLGIDLIEKDKKINEYCDNYSNLWNAGKIEEARDMLKQAVTEFPGNYDLLSKYMNALIQARHGEEYLMRIKPEVDKIYDIIQNHCTVDSIRIWVKKLMCRYLRNLSLIKGNNFFLSDAEKILEEMPIMQNTRDYEAMFMYPYDKEKQAKACANGTMELLKLFGEIMNRKNDNPLDYDENIVESYINLVEAVMPDGDYGKCTYLMVYNYGILGVKKYLKGDIKTAINCFEKSLFLAKKYDELPKITTHTSFSVEGLEFNKIKAYKGCNGKLLERVKFLLFNRYPLSEEFKSSEEFRKILENIG